MLFFSILLIGSAIHRHTRELHEPINAKTNVTMHMVATAGVNIATDDDGRPNFAAETLRIVAPAEPKPQSMYISRHLISENRRQLKFLRRLLHLFCIELMIPKNIISDEYLYFFFLNIQFAELKCHCDICAENNFTCETDGMCFTSIQLDNNEAIYSYR